nr:sumo conjugating enzyme [Colletotrichum truncatum]KAF6782430.1 sumo conjugating enzyme [Colletotrichum truncatum]
MYLIETIFDVLLLFGNAPNNNDFVLVHGLSSTTGRKYTRIRDNFEIFKSVKSMLYESDTMFRGLSANIGKKLRKHSIFADSTYVYTFAHKTTHLLNRRSFKRVNKFAMDCKLQPTRNTLYTNEYQTSLLPTPLEVTYVFLKMISADYCASDNESGILGKKRTIWEGGLFKLTITFPEAYVLDKESTLRRPPKSPVVLKQKTMR